MSDKVLQSFLLLLVSGIISLVFVKFYPEDFNKNEPIANAVLAQKKDEVNPEVEKKVTPTSIYFPTLNLNLAISEAIIVDSEWSLYEDKVSWLSTSEEPGEGNVIIYAHNRPGLFGDLDKLALGDEIIIDHNNGRFKYGVTDSHKVKPNEIEAVLSDENRLTLYTCDGAFDQKRLIVIAEPI